MWWESKKSVCLSVWMSGCTWTFAVDTITFEGVSGSKQNLVGVFYVWNVGLVLKSKVKSWSWSWSWSWTGFWFWQKLCGATSLVGIKFHCEILMLVMILILKKKKIWKNSMPLDASPFTETKRTLCICFMKNMIYSKRSKSNSRLVWCVRYSSWAHTTHITLDVKSLIPSPHRIIYYYIFFGICDI